MVDYAGQRFSRLLALEPMRKAGDSDVFWRCRCDCGNTSFVRTHLLKKVKSCGCYRAERVSEVKKTHGLSGSATYRAWHTMRQRCRLTSNRNYPNYGGRGITYDPRWDDFENFLADMGEVPPNLELDRENNDGDYCKSNCRWATRLEQENNKRNNVVVEFRGERLTVAQLSRKAGLTHSQLLKRIKRGWSAERAVTVPIAAQRNQGFVGNVRG